MKQNLSAFNFLLFSAFILLMMPFFIKAQEPKWILRLKQMGWMSKVGKIELLKSTRADVEQILGKPEKYPFKTADWIESYNTENGSVSITYTTKECRSNSGEVNKDVVEEILFSLEKDVLFSKLKIPLNQFKKVPYSDTPGFSYENEVNGVDFGVDENKIHSVEFYVPEQKNFDCVTPSTFLSDLEKIRNLKLLVSNRDEVRKIFAEYKKSDVFKKSEYNDTFYSSDASFEFSYSEGKCRFDDPDQYESSEWNVQTVKISPINSINPKEFGIDLTKYKKEQIYNDDPNLYVYYDKDLGISFRVTQGKIDEINYFPERRDISLMCDKERAKMIASTESLFTEKLKDRFPERGEYAFVDKLNISQNEIIINCDSPNTIENKDCLNKIYHIDVFTQVKNPLNDVLTYSYTVTGGKIIGRGAKVVWDLSGVKAGTYTITGAVDDGCGFCGEVKTKTIVVKECSSC